MSREAKVPYDPPFAFHPGVFLAEKLEEMKMSNKEFALRTNKPEKTITAIIKGESSITPDMAVVFETALGIPAYMWLKYQSIYDEFKARERKEELLKESIPWMKRFPVAEMINKGWLPEAKTPEEKTKALLQFFGIASYAAWEDYYLNQKLKTVFSISLFGMEKLEPISVWLRRGELEASEIEVPEFSASKLKTTLSVIKRLPNTSNGDISGLKELLAKSGVKIVLTPVINKIPLTGATRWLAGETPLIQLSDKIKSNEQFQLTLFHQIGHILLHGKKDIFLNGINYPGLVLSKEREAETFASKWILNEPAEPKDLKLKPATKLVSQGFINP
ncbi:MAG: XRE family transcriptional regulator [Ignavibacteriaceae bacterium]|nr:MAG: addiction module antidote protein, HigA family [Chlorobiota bacterium]GJQ32313.1 MAG: XRE family transcriptional regulator [Ignavibacteriaceae bacterium]